ncbi:MAG: hypothetical protein IT207_03540 [Fimbriimonadaceae bacterium]|nr:hypothetical protein [Fimbriimonadaceae bacterium]
MKLLVIAAAAGAAFAAVLAAKDSARPAPAKKPDPPGASTLLQAHDELFNDMSLVAEGSFGTLRIPSHPPNAHKGISSRDALGKPGSSRSKVQQVRLKLSEAGTTWEEGFVTPSGATSTKQNSMFRSDQPTIALWLAWNPELKLLGNVTRGVYDHKPGQTEIATKIAAAAKEAGPKEFKLRQGDWTLTGRGIPFRSMECLSCHEGAKVGDVATIAVIAEHKPDPE